MTSKSYSIPASSALPTSGSVCAAEVLPRWSKLHILASTLLTAYLVDIVKLHHLLDIFPYLLEVYKPKGDIVVHLGVKDVGMNEGLEEGLSGPSARVFHHASIRRFLVEGPKM